MILDQNQVNEGKIIILKTTTQIQSLQGSMWRSHQPPQTIPFPLHQGEEEEEEAEAAETALSLEF